MGRRGWWWSSWVRAWAAWGLRRVAGGRYALPRRSRLAPERLEDRLAPAAAEPTFRGGLTLSSAELTGDGIPDLVGAPGPTAPPLVVAYSGADGAVVGSFFSHEPGFLGGVFVAVGDVTGDGRSEVVAGAGGGGGARVTVTDPLTGTQLASFFAYDPGFRGGVRVAVADLDGDGVAEVVTAPGEGGGPHVRVFDGAGRNRGRDFFAYAPDFRGGVAVAAGDTDGDGAADVITAPGAGGAAHVKVFDGPTGAVLASYLAFDPSARGGAWVAAGDVDGNGLADAVVGAGAGADPVVGVFGGRGTQFAGWQVYETRFRGGVRVAAADLDGDAFADVLTGPGEGGGPRITAWDGYTFANEQSVFAVTDGRPLGLGVSAPPPRAPLFDGRTLLAPGDAGAAVAAAADLLRRFTDHPGEVGLYRVDDAEGAVGGLAPGEPGYAAAALAADRRRPLFPAGSGAGRSVAFDLPAGVRYGVYLVRGGSVEDWLVANPANDPAGAALAVFPFAAANPGAADLFRVGPRNRAAFEDTPGADEDLNDALVAFRAAAEVPDPPTLPQPPANSAPTVSDVPDLATTEGVRVGPVAFTVGDAETPAAALVVTVTTSDPLLLPAGGVVITGTGSNRSVTVTPAAGRTGRARVTLTVSDGALTAADSFEVVVNPRPAGNTPPTVSAVPDQATAAGTAVGPVAFTVGDVETPAADLGVTAVSSDPVLLPAGAITLGGAAAARTVTLAPAAGRTGSATVTLTVSDGDLRSTGTFTLLVRGGEVFFPTDLAGWAAAERGGTAGRRGSVAPGGGRPVLAEGDSFVTTLSRSFAVPAGAAPLSFTYESLGFDTSDPGFVNDAFEAALLDAAGNPLVPAFAPGRDAFFNVTDGGAVAVAAGAVVAGRTVTLDLAVVPAGTVATLVFRLVNNDRDTGSAVTLATVALPSADPADAAVKFFVADAAADRAFRYGAEGLDSGGFDTPGVGDVRGAASNPAGDRVWLVDAATREVSVFGPAGGILGRWAADASDPQGVSVHNGDLWLVDRGTQTVRRYAGGMGRTAGAAAADAAFALDAANASPSDLVTDGATVWVTDDGMAAVFVYDVAGTLLGRWELDGDNTVPSGITRNPAGGADLWVLDRARRSVFHYPTGANARTGRLGAVGTFDLGAAAAAPEGLADPPPTLSVTSSAYGGQSPQDSELLISGVGVAFSPPPPALPPAPGLTAPAGFGVSAFASVPKPYGLALAPDGSPFGADLYVSSSIYPYDSPAGPGAEPESVFRVSPAGVASLFSALPPEADPYYMRFAPAGSAYGEFLYVSANNRDGGRPGDHGGALLRVDRSGNWFDFTSLTSALPGDLTALGEPGNFAFAPGGAFGTGLYIANSTDYPGDVLRVGTQGDVAVFVNDGSFDLSGQTGLRTLSVAFGPGGGFGTNLYITDANPSVRGLRTVDPAGQVSAPLATFPGLPGFMAFGPGGSFGFDLYVSVATATGTDYYRVKADGTKEVFLSGLTSQGGIAFSRDGRTMFVADPLADTVYRVEGTDAPHNRIVSVTVNGAEVEALDAGGSFVTHADVRAGVNRYHVVATDLYGQQASADLTVTGVGAPAGAVDLSRFVDVTAGFRPEYARTAFHEQSRTLYADVAVRNVGSYPTGVPLYAAVRNVSDPAVRVLGAAGTLPDGTPYYDFTGLVTGGGALAPGAATGTLSLAFANPNRSRFTYDLVFFGVPNRPPAFTSVPELEATVGRGYAYAAAAADPDGDPLSFSLVAGPAGMAVDPATGELAWTPTAGQVGAQAVTLRVSDARGGFAEQTFTLVAAAPRPNRPPVFTTRPVADVDLGSVYQYDADAADPDADALTFLLAAGAPQGMMIDPATGVITWTPAAAQLGHAAVTVVVADGRGGTAAQAFEVCVGAGGNRPPVIVSTAPPVAFVAASSGIIESTFDIGLDGWTSDHNSSDISWVSTGGNPAGYLRYAQIPIPHPTYAIAPSRFLGDLSSYVGGVLSFDQRILNPGTGVWIVEPRAVILSGPGGSARWVGPIPAVSPTDWLTFSIPFEEASWEVTAGSWDNLVRNVSSLRIKIEMFGNNGGPDSSGLDNVRLSGPPIPSYRYQAAALDPDGALLSYTLTRAPAGMGIDGTTGVVTWAPPQSQAGQTVPVTVRVDDGRGGFDEQSFNVTVIDPGSAARGFDPVVEWRKTTYAVRPDSNQVTNTPLVIDLTGDGISEIVYSTYSNNGSIYERDGLVRAVSGVDGTELWAAIDPAAEVVGAANLAAGDLDGDGKPEIIALHESYGLMALSSTGQLLWVSPVRVNSGGQGGAAIADLDGDGKAEVLWGSTVLNYDGSLRWNGANIPGTGYGVNAAERVGALSVVADLDMDGVPEVLAGRTAFRADGSVYWNANVPDGFVAIGQFDSDPFPEVVLVANGQVYLLNHDGSRIWGGVTLPGGGRGGPPTVADMNGDGVPEIGVAGAVRYAVFDSTGRLLWQQPIQDTSSNFTGSSVFDFDGDGSAEVVYSDEQRLWIFRGSDGTPLYQLAKKSSTHAEYPVVADVDGDGNAEIVTGGNTTFQGGSEFGLYVIGDRNNTWVNTRRIWNQHSYHVTNVNDDGTIPAHEANSWEVYNTYRLNVLTSGSDPRSAPDLRVSGVRQAAAGGGVTLTATVRNDGSALSPGVSVAFYDGDPANGGRLIATRLTTTRLRGGDSEDVAVTVAAASVNDLWVVADDDGTGLGAEPEYDETNNALRAGIDLDPVGYAPRFTRPLTPAETAATANAAFRLRPSVLDPDGDPLAFDLPGAPEGMLVHPTLGVVAWVPTRDQVGTHQVVLRATDVAGNVTLLPFDVTVSAPNTAPVFTSAPPAGAAAAGRPYEYRAAAQDAEQPAPTYSLRNALPGMAVDPTTGVFTWTPTAAQAGTRTVTLVASDGTLEDVQTFTVAVAASAPNVAPLAAAEAPAAAPLGQPWVARVTAADPDGDPVRFALVQGPAGMTVDPVTGVVRWTPAALTGTPEPVAVAATDGRGGEGRVSFAVTATARVENRPPVVTSTPPRLAVVGDTYAYDLAAADPDGGPVLWSLVAGPQGVSLDPVRGTLRWVPAPDQDGDATVTVRATDQLFGAGEQTFTVSVSCANLPPELTSRPPTVAYAGDPYVYAVRATDPEGDPLTFSLDAAPAGMAFVPGTSLLRWTPTLAQAGPQAVVVRVTDRAGNVVTQAYTVVVSTEAPNRPPVVTSRPPILATVGRAYAYLVAVRDPDGDLLAYRLTDAPEGMTIDDAGLVTWTPAAPANPTVTVEVTDGRGGVGVQTFTLTARANRPPEIDPLPAATAAVGAAFRAAVRATDPEGDPLTYTLVTAVPGMAIDREGRISWTAAGPPRTETVRVAVADAARLTTTAAFTLTIVADTEAPVVQIDLSQTRVGLGGTVSVQVRATDNVGVEAITLTANGVPVTLSADNRATVTPDAAGRVTFAATATDGSGNVGTATAELLVYDPSAGSAVTAAITRLDLLTAPGTYRQIDPAAGVAELSYLTEVVGTVQSTGNPLAEWRLVYAPAELVDAQNLDPDAPAWRTIAQGTSPVVNGRLGTFDPTLLPNDPYVIAVVAYDVLGRGYVSGVDVALVGNAKLGEFRLDFTDLSLPLNGIPVQITRTYDTRLSGEVGDFGYGWTIGVRDARIRETVPPGPGDGLFSSGHPFVPSRTKVYLTNPAGQRVGFTYTEQFVSAGLFSANFRPVYVPDPGVTDRLESDGLIVRGLFGFFDYNPDAYRLTTPDGLTYSYDQFNGLQRIDDRNGNFVTFSPTAITHSGGRVIALDRDGQGRVTAVHLPDGTVAVRYRYDANGDLVEVRQVTEVAPVERALVSTFTYRTDRPHYLDEYFDPNGRRAVKTEYDASGRVIAVTDADNHRVEQDFSGIANFTETVRDARGNPTLITYNDRGNVTRTLQPTEFGDVVTQYAYEDAANPDRETRVVNPRGFATTRSFDARGNLLAETTPDGTTAYAYNALNKLTRVTDPLNRTTAYAYDPAGNLVRVVNPLGDDSAFTYDPLGRVATFEDFAGNVTVFSDYCACGRPLTTTNPDGTVRRIETNGYSQVTKVTDEEGHVTQNFYDQQGRLVRVVDGEGNATRYEYEGVNQTKVIDPLGNETVYAYDGGGRRTRITDAEGGVTTFTYDANGNLETVTDPVNNLTRFVYDAANRLKEEIDPLGASRLYEYDAAGNRVRETDRNGRVRTFVYDPTNRVTAENWLAADGSVTRVIRSRYDAVGNLLEASDPDATLTYTYDSLNRVATATTAYPGTGVPVVTLTYGYDANGNRTSVADDTGVRVVSHYNDRNQLEWRTWQGGGVDPARVEFDYFANGERKRLKRFADLTGTVQVGSTDYTYYKNGLSKTIDHRDGAGALLVGYGYQYDIAGRLTQESHHGDTYAYGYDRTGQLLTVVKNGSLFESFSYDANGNRRTSTGPNGDQTYQPAGPGNQLLDDGLFRYTYDREGNLKTKTEIATSEVTEYAWDYRNRLVKVEQRSGGGIILSLSEYAYDTQGRRVLQKVDGEALPTVYDGEHAWADYFATGEIAAHFLFGDWIDEIVASWKPTGGMSLYLTDKLGTVRDLADSEGSLINTTGYSAFGQIVSHSTQGVADRFAYTGREAISALSDYYYRARYYDSATGRFLSVDPLEFAAGDLNLYRYVGNAPLRSADPTGLAEFTEYQKLLYAISGSLHPPETAYFILTTTRIVRPLGAADYFIAAAETAAVIFSLLIAGIAGFLELSPPTPDGQGGTNVCTVTIEGNPRIVIYTSSCTPLG
ncbi:MAG: putative Ig domain-containing protein [Gemmataceae bacterium]